MRKFETREWKKEVERMRERERENESTRERAEILK